jgi:hypothetical protein
MIHLLKKYPDFDLKLGFDSCCCCGKAKPTIECQSCHRVKYCSKKCCKKDSAPVLRDADTADEDEEEEQALGHSSVICALLGLCNDDEIVDFKDSAEMASLDKKRRTAATDRLISEFESYPATLANVIMEGPCYQDVLESCSSDTLTIHVIGASEDSELWKGHPDLKQESRVFEGYADALAEIAENFKLRSIRLEFFGPECPKHNINKMLSVPPIRAAKSTTKLMIKTCNEDYRTDGDSLPHIIVFFNPGFTCPDYDWEPSLSCLKTNQIPFLVTTNTEMEAMADLHFLHDQRILFDIPKGLDEMLLQNGLDPHADNGDDNEDCMDSTCSFLSLNPYAGLRVRQSGTMANDLYVKSRWILGGISSKKVESNETSRRSAQNRSPSATKKRRKEGSGNTKKSNPALV